MNPPMNPNQGVSYITHSRGGPSLSMMLGAGNQASMHIPPTLDSLNDFPSLGDATINQFSQSQMSSRTDYSGMVRDNGMAPVNQIEFNIQSEDFPALPGVAPGSSVPSNSSGLDQNQVPGVSVVNVNNQQSSGLPGDHVTKNVNEPGQGSFMQQQHQMASSSSHDYTFGSPLLNACYKFACHPDFDKEVALHNSSTSDSESGSRLIPRKLLKNPFGIIGLLQSIREKPFYGIDLKTIGQEVNPSDKNPLTGFSGSMFCDIKPRVFERLVIAPDEYYVWGEPTLPNPPKLQALFQNFSEENLFVHFYLFNGSKFQRLAANELYQRDWRFHKGEKIWIRRKVTPFEENSEYEYGEYLYFDYNHFKTLSKEMKVVYQCLDLDPKSEDTGPSSLTSQ